MGAQTENKECFPALAAEGMQTHLFPPAPNSTPPTPPPRRPPEPPHPHRPPPRPVGLEHPVGSYGTPALGPWA